MSGISTGKGDNAGLMHSILFPQYSGDKSQKRAS